MASFHYDTDGRLVELTRESDGETYLTQSWTYEDGVLVSRSNSMLSAYSWAPGGDNAEIQSPIDYESHWNQSLVTTTDGCSLPPLSLYHGYPDDESVYQLGWSKNDVPNQVGFAYGYSGYGWSYGDYSWFGHAGIASIGGMSHWDDDTGFESTIHYQDGVMTDEVITSTAANGFVHTITRSRDLENGKIISDEVSSTLESEEGNQEQSQLMSFAYDQDGKLITRDLHQNDVHTHQQTWAYNSDGEMVEHTISQLYSEDDAALSVLAMYRQTITQDASDYQRIREQYNANTDEWIQLDVSSRGSHSRGRFESKDGRFVVFDANDQLVMKGQGDPEAPSFYDSWANNELALLESWESGAYDTVEIRSYSYTCEE